MAVQVVQKKSKVTDVSKVDITEVVTPEVVDAFAKQALKVSKQKKKLAPLEKKFKSDEASILKAVDEVFDEATAITLFGDEYELVLGPKGESTKLTNPKLAVELLGEELFLKLASISVTDLRKYLTPDQVAKVTETSRTTKRRVKVEPVA